MTHTHIRTHTHIHTHTRVYGNYNFVPAFVLQKELVEFLCVPTAVKVVSLFKDRLHCITTQQQSITATLHML